MATRPARFFSSAVASTKPSVAVGCLYVGLAEAAAKRPIGPHEWLVLSTVRGVDASHGSRLLEVIPACRTRASAAGKSRGRGTFGAEHTLRQGVQRGRHLEVRGRVPRALQRRGHPPIPRPSRVSPSAHARTPPRSPCSTSFATPREQP